MNMKLSGAQIVLVPITTIGRNYLPFVEHIDKRTIKYIDFAPAAYLPGTAAPGLTTSADLSITIFDEDGTKEIHRNLPLERLDYTQTIGVRQPICRRIAMDSCYINCENPAAVGTTAALVFWYELPQYSAANKTDIVQTDSVEIPIKVVERYNPMPDSDRMTGKRFRRILLGTPSTTPDGNPGLASANMQNCYLTLCKGSYRILDSCPLNLLYQLQMLEKTEFQNIIFDFESSYITVGGAGTITPSTDYVGKYVFLNLQYEA